MKDYAPLEELAESLRADVVRFYQVFDSQDINGLLELAKIFVSKNFTLSHWIGVYQFERDSLEAEYKHKVSVNFSKYKLDGDTDKQAESRAKTDWHTLLEKQLEAGRNYTISKQLHGDVENLLNMLRTKISISRKELDVLSDTKGNI